MPEPADVAAGEPPEPKVLAAGGVVVRRGDHGGAEVLLVHRPRYDDWSLPKGKCDPGETFEATAIREVREETGYEVAVGDELAPTRYLDHKGRPKLVRYFAMEVRGGAFVANDEVDEIRWLAPDAARALLTYAHDRQLLAEIAGDPAP